MREKASCRFALLGCAVILKSTQNTLYRSSGRCAVVWCVLSRRLDDRIRHLCGNVVRAREAELEPAITELKVALREHTVRLRKLTGQTLAGKTSPPPERRAF